MGVVVTRVVDVASLDTLALVGDGVGRREGEEGHTVLSCWDWLGRTDETTLPGCMSAANEMKEDISSLCMLPRVHMQ